MVAPLKDLAFYTRSKGKVDMFDVGGVRMLESLMGATKIVNCDLTVLQRRMEDTGSRLGGRNCGLGE
jgi:hypothetical protein